MPRTGLNLYVFPEEIDYVRERRSAPSWHRLDSCVRARRAVRAAGRSSRPATGKLVYLSLGSLARRTSR